MDVGGGKGEGALAVWRKFRHLVWTTQDSGHQDDSQEEQDLSGTTIFRLQQDYLEPQLTKLASVFLLRRVLYKWSDRYCHKILRNLIPSFATGDKILIMDHLMKPSSAMPRTVEREMRARDVFQLALSNGPIRDRLQWRRLLREADPVARRFHFERFIETEGSELVVIEVIWKG